MSLIEYINKYYGGNQSVFAAVIGKPRQRVSEWIKSSDWYVYDGMMMQKKITLPNPQ